MKNDPGIQKITCRGYHLVMEILIHLKSGYRKKLLSMHIIWAQFKMIIYNLTKKFDRMRFFRLLAPKILG